VPSGFVLDASVLVARLRRSESAHTDVRTLMLALAANNVTLCIPTIALAEVAGALSRSGASAAQALAAASALRRLPGLSVVGVDEQLGDSATTLAAYRRIRGCDAVYVALAQVLEAHLITLDHQQRERAPRNVVAQTPTEALATLT
jgi:predicted nucleic acid-binding protein